MPQTLNEWVKHDQNDKGEREVWKLSIFQMRRCHESMTQHRNFLPMLYPIGADYRFGDFIEFVGAEGRVRRLDT